MTPEDFLARIIDDGLAFLHSIGGPSPSLEARRMLLAIAMQEVGSGLKARYQNHPAVAPGPARGWWQFEQGGGVAGVLNHAATRDWARKAAAHHEVSAEPAAVWRALEGHDQLATVFARLLLWSDPRPLPTTEQEAWDYYLRNWRPGKPHQSTWAANWQTADRTVRASARET